MNTYMRLCVPAIVHSLTTMDSLVHYSATPLTMPLTNVDPGEGGYSFKPRGLYLCHGDTWADYVHRHHGIDLGVFKYRVNLTQHAKMYLVDSVASVMDLDAAFGTENGPRWAAMAKAGYDGIVVENYRRLRSIHNSIDFNRFLWLYTLDVDCVCVWNANSAVASFERVV